MSNGRRTVAATEIMALATTMPVTMPPNTAVHTRRRLPLF